jgi:murein DD-endopeptidase
MKTVGFSLLLALRGLSAIGLFVVMMLRVDPVFSSELDSPKLTLPIDCQLGDSCWLVNLVDVDSSADVRDYRCGQHSYDGHKGVDIAIRNLAAMEKGVAVLAAAPGVVKGVRDGMPDKMPDESFRRRFKHLYCGNGMVVTHAAGWETQYCHLRKGSVAVKAGDQIKRGQKLGLVGHSGMTEFPHIHLAVRRAGKVIDPFLGDQPLSKSVCRTSTGTLWTASTLSALSAPMTAIFNTGFAAEPPKDRAIRKGLYNAKALSRRSPVLVFWVETWWVRQGDKLEIIILNPDRQVIVRHTSLLPKKQARRMIFAGQKKKGLFWPGGVYTGEVKLTRTEDGKTRRFFGHSKIILRD